MNHDMYQESSLNGPHPGPTDDSGCDQPPSKTGWTSEIQISRSYTKIGEYGITGVFGERIAYGIDRVVRYAGRIIKDVTLGNAEACKH
jgi:hypothetical protein